LTRKKNDLANQEFQQLCTTIKTTLLEKALTIHELSAKYNHQKEKIIKTTRWMLDQGEIYCDDTLKLHLNKTK